MYIQIYKTGMLDNLEEKFMKKIFAIIVAFMFTMVFLSGCGEKISTDEAFIKDLEAGLEARWDIVDGDNDDNESKEYWESLFNAELVKIEKYKDEDFDDKELGQLAKEYIAAIEGGKEALEKHDPGTNYDRFWNDYSPYYGQRTKIFCKINKGGYGLKVSDSKYQDNFDGLIADGWAVELMENIKFEKSDDGFTYHSIAKNDSGYDFDYLQFEILEKNNDGNTVDTTYASVSNWDNETEREFEFYAGDKTESYEIISVTSQIK